MRRTPIFALATLVSLLSMSAVGVAQQSDTDQSRQPGMGMMGPGMMGDGGIDPGMMGYANRTTKKATVTTVTTE